MGYIHQAAINPMEDGMDGWRALRMQACPCHIGKGLSPGQSLVDHQGAVGGGGGGGLGAGRRERGSGGGGFALIAAFQN